ncbi:MAG: hypothetical protein JOZ99_07840 [Actinobacteria bacterium]|nr:hypothetical protein [Actinomycetota bacterium]
MTDEMQRLNEILRPVAPPRELERVYTEDQYERMLDVIRRNGPWPTITAHHFETVEELMATSNGGMADNPGLTLDDVATAHFRGILGEDSISFFPALDDCYYNSRFLRLVREYWDAQYARPTLMLFNLCGPHHSGLNAHLDAVTFRGIRIENSPVWLQNVMGRSGLFTEYLVKMAQVIAWWYLGENGTFTYWPDGPLGQPKRLEHPLWNKGVVVQNEMMFHRGDPVGRPDERDIPRLKHRSLIGYDARDDDWVITTDGEVIRRYGPAEMRLLIHWSAEVYADMDEVKKNMDHSDDLTHDIVFERLLGDMRSRGIDVAEPTDPLHDQAFIRALIGAYSVTPTTDWAKPAA